MAARFMKAAITSGHDFGHEKTPRGVPHFSEFLRSRLALSHVQYPRRLDVILMNANLSFQLTENFRLGDHSMPGRRTPRLQFPLIEIGGTTRAQIATTSHIDRA